MQSKIEKLLSEMSLEEKVAQVLQLANVQKKEAEELSLKGTVGSVFNLIGEEKAEYRAAAEASRLKIPHIYGVDAIHGHAFLKEATIFPSQLAVACSFNEDLIEKMGEITGREVAADGSDWVFSPVLCLGRDLRWGRIDETFGEDPLLSSRLGAAIIKGYQKDGMVAACAKHYLGYGEATGGRDSYDTQISERKVREVLLKPFKAAVDAGCMTMMTAYGSIDGAPLTTSHHYLTEILREELGFNGFVVTDWDNFSSLYQGQRAAENMEEACAAGLSAGNDMCMVSIPFYEATVRAVQSGLLPESVLNQAVLRVLSVKERLGLLDGSRVRPDRSEIGCRAHAEVNYRLTVESSVLLKNDGILPLRGKKKIAVVGANADDVFAQYGDWTYFSHPSPKPDATPKESVYTLLKGVREVYSDCEIIYAKGCSVDGSEGEEESEALLREALQLAKDADVVIVALGDNQAWTGEWKDLAHPILRGRQVELVQKLHETGKPTVAVLVNGKPLVLTEIERCCNAVVESFNGGDFGGLAVARQLKGEEEFSGRLPISFPREVGAGPYYYNQYDYWHGSTYKDCPDGYVLYPFGYGLSYASVRVEALRLSKPTAKRGEKVQLLVDIYNESARAGKPVVQVYMRDKVCRMLTPIRQLIDFKKVDLAGGERQTLVFEIAVDDLGYYDEKCNYRVDDGAFDLSVSLDGVHFTHVEFNLSNAPNAAK